jgi:putative ABC transport system substrate-binding protein
MQIARRRFLATTAAAVLTAVPVVGEGQPTGKMARIGVLSGDSPGNPGGCLAELRKGLTEFGYFEGRTHVLEIRYAEGRTDVFATLAADLVQLKPDLIVSVAGPAAPALKEATSSIPVVLASSFYPVELGVIASLARPGGNVTGVTHFTPELMAKRVQLLKEAVPTVSRMAVLRLAGRIHDLVVHDMTAAARALGVQLQAIEVRRAEDLSAAFDTLVAGRVQAVMTTQAPFFNQNSVQIAQLALKHRRPSLSGEPQAATAGALLFYGPNIWEGCRRAAKYVDRILKGAKPADLPVEQPTKFELVINLKTAKALGLTIPPSVLARADKVIE